MKIARKMDLDLGKVIERKNLFRLGLAFSLSFALTYIYLVRFTSFLMYSRNEKYETGQIFLFTIIPLLTIIFYLLIDLVSEIKYPFVEFMRLGLFSAILTALFLIFIYKTPPFPKFVDLIIKPVIETKNQVNDNQIQIISISVHDMPGDRVHVLPMRQLEVSDSWKISPNETSATLTGTGRGIIEFHQFLQGDIKIVFRTSPQAGRVTITLNDQEQVIDLFSTNRGFYEVDLPMPFKFHQADGMRKTILIGSLITHSLVFWTFSILILILVDQVFVKKSIRTRGASTAIFVISLASSMIFFVNRIEKEVIFVDEQLEAAIREIIGNQDKPIYFQQLQTISTLDITGKEIHSLQGIEYLKNLVELNAGYNYITDLSPLSSLTHLAILNLEGNNITDLELANFDDLTKLPIRNLNLSNNFGYTSKYFPIKLHDIRLLGEFPLLEELILENNDIADISTIAQLTNLRTLNLRDNRINSLPNLCNNKSLLVLNLRNNGLKDIEALSCLTSLKELNLHSNPQIVSIYPLKNLRNLRVLTLENVPVYDQLQAIDSLTQLTSLNLNHCQLFDISTLGYLMSKGGLQDIPEQGVFASLYLRDNPQLLQNPQALIIINKYWNNITNRDPTILPQIEFAIQPPQFSMAGGLYTNAFNLNLSSEDPDLLILYTLDGSDPGIENIRSPNPLQQTLIYSDTIKIKSRVGDPNKFSLIKTADKAQEWIPDWHSPKEEVFKATVIRARTYDMASNSYSKMVTNTYFVDENISSRYKNLPIISISADYQSLFDPDTGIYTPAVPTGNYIEPYRYSERRIPANIEFFEIGGDLGFEGLYDISLQGMTSRSSPQKGLNVVVNEWLGEEAIYYPIFKDTKSKANQLNEFKRFIIRSWGSSRDWPMIFSDAYNQTLLATADIDIQDYRPVIVFINGEYWGLHEIRQAIKNPEYFSSVTGLDPENPGFDILQERDSLPDDGDSSRWKAIEQFLQTHDMSIDENYQYIRNRIDIDNFITYVIHCTFTGKRDWPGHNESKWSPRLLDGKWRWLQYDMDHGLNSHGRPQYDMIAHILPNGRMPYPVFISLLENIEFKEQFLNTYADYLNSYFLTSVELAHFSDMIGEIEPYIPEYQDRWQLNLLWEDDKAYAINSISRRHDLRLSQLIRNFNLENTYQLTLKAAPSQGHIKINSIVIDNNLPGVDDSSSWSGIYFGDIPVTISALPQPGYRFDHWETTTDIGINSLSDVLHLEFDTDTTLTAVFSRID